MVLSAACAGGECRAVMDKLEVKILLVEDERDVATVLAKGL